MMFGLFIIIIIIIVIIVIVILYMSRNNTVRMVTGLHAGKPTNRGQNLYHFSKVSTPALWPSQPPTPLL
jgi:ABC-type transport system involved in multi-copper enzyme maturation permease subunit